MTGHSKKKPVHGKVMFRFIIESSYQRTGVSDLGTSNREVLGSDRPTDSLLAQIYRETKSIARTQTPRPKTMWRA
jgi:hypothetical protein